MKNKYYYFLFLFILSIGINAQTQLSGIVVIDFTNRNADGINIFNKTKKIYTESDISGHFSIEANEGDSIIFKADFLEKREFLVTKESLNKKNLVIHLNMETIQLDELIVKPKLTGYLEKDIASIPKDNKIEKLYASLGIDIRTLDIKPEEKKGKILPAILPTQLDIEVLYKTFSGYYRKMDNLRQYDSYIKKIEYVKEYIGDDFFTYYLKIPKEEIFQFILFVEGKYSYEYNLHYFNHDFLSLRVLLESKKEEYLKRIHQRDVKSSDKN